MEEWEDLKRELRSGWEPWDLVDERETRGVLRLLTAGESSMGEEEGKWSLEVREVEGRSSEGTVQGEGSSLMAWSG